MTEKHCRAICASSDKVLEQFIENLPMETSFHRAEAQKAKCGFGLQGVCCRLCSNGPCRITTSDPSGVCGANQCLLIHGMKRTRGVCGADADTIVVRNFLRSVSAGSGCYIHVIENTARNLKSIALAKGTLKGLKTLEKACETLGIGGANVHEKALNVANAVLADIYKPDYEKMALVEKLAYPPRYERWAELGILPGGSKSEVFSGTVKTSTNLSSDPVDMLLHCLRLGISTGLYGLALTNILNDIILGEPEIRMAPVGFGVIDPKYINIMLIGHQQSLFAHLQDRLMNDDAVKKAKKVGASGFKLIGCTCVGQDYQLRGAHSAGIYNGHAGNNFTSEAVLATGAIDAVITEFNCALPGIEPICDELKIKQICIDSYAKKANATLKEFTYENRAAVADEIIAEVIEAYKERRDNVPMNLLPKHGNKNTLTGISETTLKEFLGGTWEPLINLIVGGQIKGIAAVVGCSNLVTGGHDVLTVEMTKELIARDIIVLTAGCSSGGLENVGLMSPEAAELAGPNLKAVCEQLGIPPVLNFGPCLAIGRLEIVASEIAEAIGIDIPQLPLVISAPQWLEEQALADGSFALALGLPMHLGIAPFLTGSPIAIQVLCEDMKALTGGFIVINSDAVESAVLLEDIIIEKRKGLNLQ